MGSGVSHPSRSIVPHSVADIRYAGRSASVREDRRCLPGSRRVVWISLQRWAGADWTDQRTVVQGGLTAKAALIKPTWE